MLRKEKIEKKRDRADKLAALLATQLHRQQQRFTSFLTKQTAPLSKRGQLAGLVVFCLLFGGASFLAILGAFQRKTSSPVKPIPVTVPKYFNRSGEALPPSLTRKDFEQIHHFKNYLDSLYGSQEGRAVYDSLIRERPGLLDSLRQMETIFYSPSK
jgi:hypothetical protein